MRMDQQNNETLLRYSGEKEIFCNDTLEKMLNENLADIKVGHAKDFKNFNFISGNSEKLLYLHT